MQKNRYDHSQSYDCFVNNEGYGIDFMVYESGYEHCDPLHCWGPEEKQYHVFHYVLSGKGKLYIKGKCYECGAGDLIYMGTKASCYYEADEKDPWEYKWVGFDGMRAEAVLENTVFSVANPVVHGVNRAEAEGHLDAIFQSYQTERASNLKAVGRLYLFFAWLVENFPSEKPPEAMTSEERFYSMLRYAHLHYKDGLKVSQIANALGYDRTYVYKTFMKYLNMSPSEYVETLRLKRACELIRSRKYPLSQVAAKVGFDNYAWFFTVFKRSCHMSPQQYADLPEVERVDCLDERFLKIDQMMERYHAFVNDGKLF